MSSYVSILLTLRYEEVVGLGSISMFEMTGEDLSCVPIIAASLLGCLGGLVRGSHMWMALHLYPKVNTNGIPNHWIFSRMASKSVLLHGERSRTGEVVFAGETCSDFAGRLAPTSLSKCIFVEFKAKTTDIGGNSDKVQARIVIC